MATSSQGLTPLPTNQVSIQFYEIASGSFPSFTGGALLIHVQKATVVVEEAATAAGTELALSVDCL
jgi:hypothetical protein